MSKMIIVTVPHNVCRPGVDVDHNGDIIEGEVGEMVDKALGSYPHIIFYGDVNRNDCDLNRAESRFNTQFRRLLRQELKKYPALLLDIHSFSKDSEKYKGSDVALGTDRWAIEKYNKEMADCLYSDGFRTFVVNNLEGDIIKEAKEYGVPAYLFEFNESVPMKEHRKAIHTIINVIEGE
jgi:hypothetical protein